MWPLFLSVIVTGLFWCLIFFAELCGAYGNECSNSSQGIIAIIALIFFVIGVFGLLCGCGWIIAFIRNKRAD